MALTVLGKDTADDAVLVSLTVPLVPHNLVDEVRHLLAPGLEAVQSVWGREGHVSRHHSFEQGRAVGRGWLVAEAVAQEVDRVAAVSFGRQHRPVLPKVVAAGAEAVD
eukprot:scaffold1782_cov414-Prasinococcus_capsulatus_cf.AAC.4